MDILISFILSEEDSFTVYGALANGLANMAEAQVMDKQVKPTCYYINSH